MSDHDVFRRDLIGRWGDEHEFVVEAERTVAYAEATNDPIEQHLSGEFAPPVFAVVPAMSVMADATLGVVPDELMMRILHGEHDFRFHRPIIPGETLKVRAKPVGIQGKDSGVVVSTLISTRGAEYDDPVNDQYFVGFFRGGRFDGTVGETAPEHAMDPATAEREPDLTVVQHFDEDQTFRYAEPAGDPMPIHLDDDFARAMGQPGIIIHGLCTIAFVSHGLIGAVCPENPTRLSRLAVRMASPAFPGTAITTTAWRTDEHDPDHDHRPAPDPDRDPDPDTTSRRYAFCTTGGEGGCRPRVLTDGLAEFDGKRTP